MSILFLNRKVTMMKKFTLILLSAVFAVSIFTACGKSEKEQEQPMLQQSEEKVEPTTAQPETAIKEIYSDIEIKGIETADDSVLTEKFVMNLEDIEDYWVKYSAKNYGVSDVFIIKPKKGHFEQVEEMLDEVKKQRITEFTNYDVYNSLQISENAVIYTRGDYVVMLMLEDTAGAKEIISSYIPS